MPNALSSLSFKKTKIVSYFPSISRYIPENIITKRHLLLFGMNFLCGFLVCAISIEGYKLYQNMSMLHVAEKDKSAILQEVSYWRSIVAQYPDYKDAYIKLATIEFELGEKVKAQEHVELALQIDPNDAQAQRVALLIRGK